MCLSQFIPLPTSPSHFTQSLLCPHCHHHHHLPLLLPLLVVVVLLSAVRFHHLMPSCNRQRSRCQLLLPPIVLLCRMTATAMRTTNDWHHCHRLSFPSPSSSLLAAGQLHCPLRIWTTVITTTTLTTTAAAVASLDMDDGIPSSLFSTTTTTKKTTVSSSPAPASSFSFCRPLLFLQAAAHPPSMRNGWLLFARSATLFVIAHRPAIVNDTPI